MKQRSRYIFRVAGFLLFLITLARAYAQDTSKPDTLKTETPDSTVVHRFLKNGEIEVDYGKFFTLPFRYEKKILGGAGLYFGNNLGICVEGGYSNMKPQKAYKNTDYQVKGYFGLAGLNYLFIYGTGARLYLGGRYGISRFSDQGSFTILNPLWNNYQGSFIRTGLKADWAEFIAGSESNLKGNFQLGFIVRLRVMISYPRFSDIPVYTIPGYGRSSDTTTPALNLYIKYLIQ